MLSCSIIVEWGLGSASRGQGCYCELSPSRLRRARQAAEASRQASVVHHQFISSVIACCCSWCLAVLQPPSGACCWSPTPARPAASRGALASASAAWSGSALLSTLAPTPRSSRTAGKQLPLRVCCWSQGRRYTHTGAQQGRVGAYLAARAHARRGAGNSWCSDSSKRQAGIAAGRSGSKPCQAAWWLTPLVFLQGARPVACCAAMLSTQGGSVLRRRIDERVRLSREPSPLFHQSSVITQLPIPCRPCRFLQAPDGS